jgi:hypothetical protein
MALNSINCKNRPKFGQFINQIAGQWLVYLDLSANHIIINLSIFKHCPNIRYLDVHGKKVDKYDFINMAKDINYPNNGALCQSLLTGSNTTRLLKANLRDSYFDNSCLKYLKGIDTINLFGRPLSIELIDSLMATANTVILSSESPSVNSRIVGHSWPYSRSGRALVLSNRPIDYPISDKLIYDLVID